MKRGPAHSEQHLREKCILRDQFGPGPHHNLNSPTFVMSWTAGLALTRRPMGEAWNVVLDGQRLRFNFQPIGHAAPTDRRRTEQPVLGSASAFDVSS
jgi:hypothetical protein